jgi:hypothetical protein
MVERQILFLRCHPLQIGGGNFKTFVPGDLLMFLELIPIPFVGLKERPDLNKFIFLDPRENCLITNVMRGSLFLIPLFITN